MKRKAHASEIYVISSSVVPVVGMAVGRQRASGAAQGMALAAPAQAVKLTDELVQQWTGMFATVSDLLTKSADQVQQNWQVDDIKLALSVDAKGKLAFLAELGATASVTVTLKRKAQ